MSIARVAARRIAPAVIAAGVVLAVAPAAAAGPGCTAGDITGVESQVAAAMTGYFFTHPEVNDFFTGLQGTGKDEAFGKTTAYFDANPQTEAEINAIRRPALDLRTRCGIPTSNLICGVL